MLILVFVTVIAIGCESQEKEVKPDILEDWETITTGHIDNAFNTFKPEVKQHCKRDQSRVENREIGLSGTESYDIDDVYYYPKYELKHEGEYLHVKTSCSFEVHYSQQAGKYRQYMQENIETPVSSFRMKKYYNQETKYLENLIFE